VAKARNEKRDDGCKHCLGLYQLYLADFSRAGLIELDVAIYKAMHTGVEEKATVMYACRSAVTPKSILRKYVSYAIEYCVENGVSVSGLPPLPPTIPKHDADEVHDT
jgi:hypothetical protein